jgi:hypothetical protein
MQHCRNCALLALYEEGASARIDRGEVDFLQRANGVANTFPQCMVEADAYNLVGELELGVRDADNIDEVLQARTKEIFARDRTCSEWMQYRQGEGPYDALQRRDAMRVELERAQLQEEIAAMTLEALKVSQAIQQEHKTITADHKALAERSDQFNTIYQRRFLVLSILTFLIGFAALVAALLPLAPDGVGWLIDHTAGHPHLSQQSTPGTAASQP